jgi:hypothetical protein
LAREFGDRKFDIVVDTVGAQELYEKSPSFLKEDGVYVNIGDFTHGMLATVYHWIVNYLRPVWLGGTPRKWIMFGPDVGPEAGVWVQKLVADGKVKAVIDRSVGFDQVLDVSTRNQHCRDPADRCAGLRPHCDEAYKGENSHQGQRQVSPVRTVGRHPRGRTMIARCRNVAVGTAWTRIHILRC